MEADSVIDAEVEEKSDIDSDAEGDGSALFSETDSEGEAVALAMSEEDVPLAHSEVAETDAGTLLSHSETEAEDDHDSLE
jgi:hypothetical protein